MTHPPHGDWFAEVESMPTWFWTRWLRGGRRLWARADWADFAGKDWGDRILDADTDDDFHQKQGRSTGRFTYTQGDRSLTIYLKRHLRLPWWRGLWTTFWARAECSPALQEMNRLAWAKMQGVLVPRIIAAGEYLAPGGRLQSFLAVEELGGMLALHQAIPMARATLSPSAFTRWKAGLIVELARICRKLHDQNIYHKDLYLCHFFVAKADIEHPPTDWRDRVALIDLQRLTRHWISWPWWLVKDLGQLLYSSLQEGVTPRDRLRFWRAYLAGAPLPWLHGLLTWGVRIKGERYRDHNAKLAGARPAPASSPRSITEPGRKCA